MHKPGGLTLQIYDGDAGDSRYLHNPVLWQIHRKTTLFYGKLIAEISYFKANLEKNTLFPG